MGPGQEPRPLAMHLILRQLENLFLPQCLSIHSSGHQIFSKHAEYQALCWMLGEGVEPDRHGPCCQNAVILAGETD